MDLADYNPDSFLGFVWGYSYKEIINFYKRKEMKYAERRRYDYDFLVNLATAALGGKKSEEEVGLLNEDDIKEMSPEQEEAMRKMLGSDFDSVFKSHKQQE